MLSDPGSTQNQGMRRASEPLSHRGSYRDHLVRHGPDLPISLLCNCEHVAHITSLLSSEDVRFVTKEANQLGHSLNPFADDAPGGPLRRIIEPLDG